MKKTKSYLVVRVSKLDSVDPIAEINRVIDKEGASWFGKYGRPIKMLKLDELCPPVLVLVIRNQKHYESATYEIIGQSRRTPKSGMFPDYYKSVLRRISSWFKIKHTEKSVEINDLIVKSSGQTLAEALHGSMSAHFLCIDRQCNDYMF